MVWFAANIIMCIKFKNGKQDFYPIYENVLLIEANDAKEAYKKAVVRGKDEEGDSSGTLFYGDKPAKLTFLGVRKITTCEDPEKRPEDGTEITYSEFTINSEEDLDKLVNGEPVRILYED